MINLWLLIHTLAPSRTDLDKLQPVGLIQPTGLLNPAHDPCILTYLNVLIQV